MKQKITHSGGNSRLILIFAGWSTDETMYSDIRVPGWDTMVCWDYDDLTFDNLALDRYDTVFLYAWSLGVKAASMAVDGKRIAAAFAINGTLNPVDDNRGIPKAIYTGTLDGLNERNLTKFRIRMAGGISAYNRSKDRFPSSEDIIALRRQLTTFLDLPDSNNTLPWKMAYIASDDKIFPPANQTSAWSAHKPAIKCVSFEGCHLADLCKIIRLTAVDYTNVGGNFLKSADIYNTNAAAQQQIAAKLTDMLREMNPKSDGDVLEIGPGAGLFTKEYIPVIRPHSIEFIDLYEIRPFGLIPSETYHVGDAEIWLGTSHEGWDYILSSSVIQWFANMPRFFMNAASHLRDHGILACSTFIEGNLHELDSIRPTPLLYPSESALRRMVEAAFTDYVMVTDTITLNFPSAKEALIHLKNTGVKGSASPLSNTAGRLSAFPKNDDGTASLTFRPAYIIARK